MTFAENYARGQAAFAAGEPFDPREGPGWQPGYGDAVTITPVEEPAFDVLDDDWQDHCGDPACEICPDPSCLVGGQL